MARRTVGPLLALWWVFAALLPGPALAQTAQPTSTPNPRLDTVVQLINEQRVSAGLLPLARAAELDSAAQGHSLDMVQHNYLDHTGYDGSEPQDRAVAAGYQVPPHTGWIVVEVISAESGDPQGPVNWWMGDAQHRRVLLNTRWRELGAGYAQGGAYGNYWTVDFGCRPGVVPTLTFEGNTYTHTEQCGDPSFAPATPTLVPSPAVVPTSTPGPST